MKIIITGGAGFIGSHIAERYTKFSSSASEIIILDNLSTGRLENIKSFKKKLLSLNVISQKKGRG